MLTIRRDQMAALEEEQRRQFAHEMAQHLRAYAPKHAARMGDEAVYHFARGGISRAALHGFTLRGPVRLFIELQVMLGSSFDTDPQYPSVVACLNQRGVTDEMARAELLHEEAARYHAQVIGVDASHGRAAIRRLRERIFEGLPEHDDELKAEGIGRLRESYPEKAAFAGEVALHALFAEATKVAAELELGSSSGKAMLFAAMFALGHECHIDQQFSWFAQTLAATRALLPEQRVHRLRSEFLAFMRSGAAPQAGAE